MSSEMIHKSLFLLKNAIETGMSVEHGLKQAFALGCDASAQEHERRANKFEKAFLDVAYELGAERNPEIEIVLAALKARLNNGNKLHDKIRDAFQANYRAAMNMLSSMTAEERKNALSEHHTAAEHGLCKTCAGAWFHWPADWARDSARQACVETWGEDAVKAALGSES